MMKITRPLVLLTRALSYGSLICIAVWVSYNVALRVLE
jgi:formate/nitrite transporter FocA (FNT family)